MEQPTSNKKEGGAELFSFGDFLKGSLTHWLWYVISLVVCLGIGVLYILYQEPVYERSEQILIKNQEAGGSINGMSSFASLGLFSSNSSVQNELISITSPAIISQVIDKLDLTMNYVSRSGLHPQTLYGTTLPITVKMKEVDLQEGASFKCELQPDGRIRLWKFVKYIADGKQKYDYEVTASVGQEVSSPIGKLAILPNPDYNGEKLSEPLKMLVYKSPMQSAIESYGKKVSGDLVDEFADVIELSIKDVSVERAVDVLNEILYVYNQDYIDDKNRIANATSAFIDERLRVIEQELGTVDSSIANYRSSQGTISFYQQGMAMTEKAGEYEENIVTLSTELELIKYIEAFVNDPAHKFSVLPANTGLQNPEVDAQIGKYNELLLNRNTLVNNSSENNPLVKDYDEQLNGMRRAISRGLANQQTQVQTNLRAAKAEQNKALAKIKSTPTQSLPIMSEERQQKVKENLYLFLLEKREENELSQKFTADNNKLVTPPMGPLTPVSPKKAVILGFAFLLGLAIPMLAVYFKITGDTKVRARKDLDNLSMPFAGEIPQVGKAKLKTKATSRKKIKLKDEKAPISVVEEGKRDVVNEAFRVIRSNLEFMSKKDTGCQVIMLTSFNPGSGKSFISYNLGLSFALKKKKVLLVDCDLRHGSSSMYVGLPSKGLTNYLVGSTDDWESLIIKSPANPNLDIMPIGKMPPNPAELLENGRLSVLVEAAKKDYDYIFLDCPPVNIVVDTQIVGQLADSTLFVVRAGLFERSGLAELDMFYKENKFKHMSLILNGTDQEHSRYYSYGNYQNLE